MCVQTKLDRAGNTHRYLRGWPSGYSLMHAHNIYILQIAEVLPLKGKENHQWHWI